MELQNLLESIGLTKQEAKCYIALYELKEGKVGIISNRSGIATANIYPVLESLVKKGLASYKILNNVKIFLPTSPESFNELIAEKQKLLDEQKEKVRFAILNLKQTAKKENTASNYKYFEGLSGLKGLWNEISEYMEDFDRNSVLKIYGSTKESSENLRGFYNEFHKKRLKLGQSYMLITDEKDEEIVKLRRSQKSQIKVMKMENEAAFGKFENMYFILYQIGKHPIGFLIKDERIAKSFDQMFNQLWAKI